MAIFNTMQTDNLRDQVSLFGWKFQNRAPPATCACQWKGTETTGQTVTRQPSYGSTHHHELRFSPDCENKVRYKSELDSETQIRITIMPHFSVLCQTKQSRRTFFFICDKLEVIK